MEAELRVEERDIGAHAGSGPERSARVSHGERRSRSSAAARVAATGALLLAVALVALLVLGSGPKYRVRLIFANASGLVSGNEVMLGPTNVGTVQSIGLTRSGQAAVVISLGDGAAPLHQGTVARIAENGLAAIAGHYVTLAPGPAANPAIPSGGTISTANTYAEVSLDQLFDTLDPLTRVGIRNLFQGEAAAIRGRPQAANKTLEYLAPALSSTSNVTAELSRTEPGFDALLVQGARAMEALASRTDQLSQLVQNTEQTTGAIARQSGALRTALSLLPSALRRSTTTFAGLRSTLNGLDPFVAASKPAVRRLAVFSIALRQLADNSVPTLGELEALIHNPSGSGDLTELLTEMPSLERVARSAFPQIIKEMNDSQNQVDYLREYAPDVVAALSDLGQAGAPYDANGHYERTQPVFNAFGLNANNQLVTKLPADRYQGLSVVHGRCPGGAVQPSPDGSAPQRVPGCNPASSP